ncbi:MAG: uroporphyrinogen decarboxylase family protein [Victivallaceae bacterium]|nr:uroporphyrinogen decarboxylase family protein [Victivallaceae bacterium]
MYKPDYKKLRDETPFSWSVTAGIGALLDITGIPEKEFFLNPSAGIELFRKGRSVLREIYRSDVNIISPLTPPISYGHINTLGAELIFPDEGEVNHSTLCDTLEAGIGILKRPVEFAKAGMLPFYLDYQQKLREAFPGENVGLCFKAEGPLTTAYTLRRDGFFYDFYDNPELTKDFLKLITESIIEFTHFLRKLAGSPEINPDGSGLADDCAAMLGPALWPEFVLPYLEQYYRGLTSGRRSAHIEDLAPEHLPFLEKLQLVNYDPSVSAKLNPRIISEKTRVPFSWRLLGFGVPYLSVQNMADFVYQAVADGASGVFTYIANGMCNHEAAEKISSFIAACKNVEKMLAAGATRREISELVSESGRKKFWAEWPKPKSNG